MSSRGAKRGGICFRCARERIPEAVSGVNADVADFGRFRRNDKRARNPFSKVVVALLVSGLCAPSASSACSQTCARGCLPLREERERARAARATPDKTDRLRTSAASEKQIPRRYACAPLLGMTCIRPAPRAPRPAPRAPRPAPSALRPAPRAPRPAPRAPRPAPRAPRPAPRAPRPAPRAPRPAPRAPHRIPYNFTAFSRSTMRASASARGRSISPSRIIPVSASASARRAVDVPR